MAILQITPPPSEQKDQRETDQYALDFPSPPPPPPVPDFNPLVLADLKDELTRSRVREAVWISMVAHMVLGILFITGPRWMPDWTRSWRLSAEDLLRQKDHDVTELALPPDEQKVTQKPQTDKISDKDRIATSKRPQLDRKALDELRDNQRPGLPGVPIPPRPAVVPQQPQSAGAPQPSQPAQQSAPEIAQNTTPRLQSPDMQPRAPAGKIGFGSFGGMSANSSVQQAAQAAAIRGSYGVGGEMGLGRGGASGKVRSDMEITSDTLGVDFGPYLARIRQIIQMNWEVLIPESARAPLFKQGQLTLSFVILPNGRVQGMRLEAGSGDVSLDRAAWGSITASDPFPPLPSVFHGPYLGLRCRYFYNPRNRDLEQ